MAKKSKSELWILNGILVTQNDSRDCFRGNIRVLENTIVEISQKTPKKIDKKAKIIHADHSFICPGFIQTHVHLCQTLFRNMADDLELLDWLGKRIWPLEAAHTKKTLEISAELGIRELMASGTTCLLDMATIHHTEAIFKTADRLGIRANIGKCLMDHSENNPTYLRENKSSALKEAEALILKWNGKKNDRLRASLAPRFVLSCTPELLKEVALLAEKHGVLIHTHCSENKKEIEWVQKMTSQKNLEYLNTLQLTGPKTVLAHGVWLSEEEEKILVETGTHLSHCPSSNLKLASGIAPIHRYLQKGISVSLGADGSPCNNNLNPFLEMRLASLLQKPLFGPQAIPAQEALDLATRNGAHALNWWDQIGSLEVGKKADIISIQALNIFNHFPKILDNKAKFTSEEVASYIVYSSTPGQCEWTMIDGKICHTQNTDPKKNHSDILFLKKVINAQKTIQNRVKKNSPLLRF